MEYYLIDTKGLERKPGPGGGLGKRETADQKMMNYIGATSVDEYLVKVENLGGKILMQKTAVPGMGYLGICMDTENNTFGFWEDDQEAQ